MLLTIRKLIPKISLLIIAVAISLYFAKHPPGKAFIKNETPPIEVLDLPRVSIEEEAIEIPKENLRNPFLPNPVVRPKAVTEKEKKATETGHVVTMILIGREKSCILDGRTVKEGEEVTKGVKVIKILPQGVWIRENGRESFIPFSLYR